VWTQATYPGGGLEVRCELVLGQRLGCAMKNIYVGNLPYSTTESELEQLFAQHGQVSRASVVIDRETGRSRGFGFVEMPDDAQGDAAIAAMNGLDMGGRKLVVNEAKPREARGGGYGGGGGGGYRGSSGGGGYSGGGGRRSSGGGGW
jgi:RNA recognition motif-containing protein